MGPDEFQRRTIQRLQESKKELEQAEKAKGAERNKLMQEQPTASPIPLTRRCGLQAMLIALTLLVMFGLGGFEVGLALQGQQMLGLGPGDIALMFTECSLVMIAVQAFIYSPLGERLGGFPVVPLAFLVMAVALGLIPYATDLPILPDLVGVVSATSGILLPTLGYLVSLHAGISQGAKLGKQAAAASPGQGLGSAAAGLLFGITMPAPFLLTAALALVGAGMGPGVGHEAVFQDG
ncbi:MAG TPA: hypothetical protein VF859_08950 [Burkholderiales bacterium]